MKVKTYAIGVIVAAGLGFASMAVHAQTTANGPYYAVPAWDQTLPSSTRFIVLSNFAGAAVLDRETGLVWEKSPSPGTAGWGGARNTCINKAVGGRIGWRLPSIQELASLMDLSVLTGPRLPSGHPFTNVQSALYWSATTLADDPVEAWLVVFSDAPADNVRVGSLNKANSFGFWCVRGGGVLDTY